VQTGIKESLVSSIFTAKKLKDCGVFGVSSNEYLDYAVKNRREWEERGESVVAEMIAKMKAEKGKGS
jgi:hypothetical protein